MNTINQMPIDNFGSSEELIEHYARLVDNSDQSVETLVEQHAALAGFDTLEEYVSYLDSTDNQIPQLSFAFSGTEVTEVNVEFSNTRGDITVDAQTFDIDLNEAVNHCLMSPRWGGTIFAFKVFDVVQSLLPYLSDVHYEQNPQLLADRTSWTGENLYFDASFKNVVAEHNSPEFSFTVTKWLSSSADLAFPESTNPIEQMSNFSDQLLGNAAALALDIMMSYLRNDNQISFHTADDLRKALFAQLVEGDMTRVAVSMVSGLYLSFLVVPMQAEQAEEMVQTLLKEKGAGQVTLVHSADPAVKH